jgi:WD40 repeat protein
VLRVWAVATGMPIEEAAGGAPKATTLAAAANGSFTATKALTLSTGASPHWVLERTLGGSKGHGVFADRVNAVRFSPDGKTLATGSGEPSRSGDVILFDVATGKPAQTWKDRHSDSVLGLDFSPDGRLLVSGAADKLAKVTEIATGKQVNLFEGHTHHVMGVAFRADGRVLATAGADGLVLTWDMVSGERKKKIEGWSKEVTSLQFVGATNQIVTSAGDNRVRIVTDEGAEVRTIASLPDYMQASVSTPDGGTIVGGGEDSFLRVWDATGKELAAFGGK